MKEEYLLKRIQLLENVVGAIGSLIVVHIPDLHSTIVKIDAMHKEAVAKLNKELAK